MHLHPVRFRKDTHDRFSCLLIDLRSKMCCLRKFLIRKLPFVKQNRLLEGLQYIPPGSRLAHAVSFVIDLHRREKVFEAAVDQIYRRFGHYHWVHTINNAALVAAALLYGKGDFETTICSVVMGGWDTDSNGATAGSVLGTLLGARRLPGKWIDPLNDRIRSSLKGFDNSAVSSLAQRTVRQIKD